MITTPDVQELIADTEAEIRKLLDESEDERTRELYEMVRYHMGLDGEARSAGKRIRPLLGLLAYMSLAGDYRAALPGAVAVELGHNFSLVHDDIEDRDVERRHRPALWTVYGLAQAINTGDALFALSRVVVHRLTDHGFPDDKILRLLRIYDETCLDLCEGQFIDIWMSEHDERMTVDAYFDMIGRKTASLIAGAVEAGAVLATEDQQVAAAYRSIGWALGIAFQLNDDLLGIWGQEHATGKKASDLAKHKKTLPVIYALEHAGPEDRERLRELYAGPSTSPADVDEIRAILERAGARDYTRAEARRYRDEALTALQQANVADGAAREQLRLIIVSAISAD